MARRSAIEVEGAKELRRLLRQIEGSKLKDALKAANKGAAEVIADEAVKLAPKRSGRLSKSIRSTGSQAAGSVKAGSKARVPYAGVIHYGWPRRNIRPQPFITDAVADKLGDARDVYEELIDEVFRLLESD